MDPIQVLIDNWKLVTSAPLGTLVLFLSGLAAGAAIMKLITGEKLEAARERVAEANEERDRLRGEKGELLKELEEHGENIAQIRADLARRSRVFSADNPPPEEDPARDGDLWIGSRPPPPDKPLH